MWITLPTSDTSPFVIKACGIKSVLVFSVEQLDTCITLLTREVT